MKLAEKPRRYLLLFFSSLGTAALFLPFAWSISPWDAVYRVSRDSPPDWQIGLLGLPFFLSIPILIWQARRLFASVPTKVEIAGAYVWSTVANAAITLTLGLMLFRMVSEEKNYAAEMALVLLPTCCLLLGNMLMLQRNLRIKLPSSASTEAFLLGSYLPNAFYCLVGFGLFEGRLQSGAYVITIVSVGYVVAILVLSRRTSIKKFEREAIEILLKEAMSPSTVASVLQRGELVGIEHTGCGYFLTLRHPGLPRDRVVCSEPAVVASCEGIETGFVVFLQDNELTLECYSWGENDVPESYRNNAVQIKTT